MSGRKRGMDDDAPGQGKLKKPSSAIPAGDVDAMDMNALVAMFACKPVIELSQKAAAFLHEKFGFESGASKKLYAFEQKMKHSLAAGADFYAALAYWTGEHVHVIFVEAPSFAGFTLKRNADLNAFLLHAFEVAPAQVHYESLICDSQMASLWQTTKPRNVPLYWSTFDRACRNPELAADLAHIADDSSQAQSRNTALTTLKDVCSVLSQAQVNFEMIVYHRDSGGIGSFSVTGSHISKPTEHHEGVAATPASVNDAASIAGTAAPAPIQAPAPGKEPMYKQLIDY